MLRVKVELAGHYPAMPSQDTRPQPWVVVCIAAADLMVGLVAADGEAPGTARAPAS